jgi:AcrR family transcriptional regulator
MRDMITKRTTRRDMRREATRAAVLEAAQQVFLARGFEGATIKMIADEAGVSPGTVLNAAPTKAALLVEILQGECEQIAESGEQLESALTGAAIDRLGALLQLMLDGHLRHTELFAAALGHRWLDPSSDFQNAFDALSFVWEPVRRVVTSALENGEFRSDLDPTAAMHAVKEVFYSAVREGTRDDGVDPRAALSYRMDVVIGGLKA